MMKKEKRMLKDGDEMVVREETEGFTVSFIRSGKYQMFDGESKFFIREKDPIFGLVQILAKLFDLDFLITKKEGNIIVFKFKKKEKKENKGSKEKIQKILEALIVGTTKTEKKLLFEVGESSTHKLEEVGQIFEITREKIRQIEAKTLEKIRKHKVS